MDPVNLDDGPGGPRGPDTTALDARLRALGRVAVAVSGGVDSSVLLHAAVRVLGEVAAVGVVADSASLARRELEEARRVAAAIGARLVELRTDEGDDPRYQANAGDRCYFCKAALFRAMEGFARAEGIPWLAFGEIADDALDHRPGARAAHEFGVVAPLAEAGWTKADVRAYARAMGLEVADKPASACLASRLPVGTRVTPERLAVVERAEDALRALGLLQLRVRHLGARARVEVGPAELALAERLSGPIAAALAAEGFEGFELAAYRSPSERAGQP
ncbi:MAG: ATP-dependent sacrificial sulfur transferase LarE [Planctomycetota bacterium]